MTEDTLADIARLRAIAEEGRRMPLLGGRHMILWGSVVALASALHGAVLAGILPWPMISAAFIWFGLTGMAALASRSLRMTKHMHGVGNDVGNRVERGVWQMGGALMWLTALGILAAAYWHLHRTGKPELFLLFTMLPPLMFGVYAIALRVASEAASVPQLRPYALLSIGFVPVTLLLAGQVWQFAAMAVGVLLVSILPGRMMIALEGGKGNG
jgi:hypothetical protein